MRILLTDVTPRLVLPEDIFEAEFQFSLQRTNQLLVEAYYSSDTEAKLNQYTLKTLPVKFAENISTSYAYLEGDRFLVWFVLSPDNCLEGFWFTKLYKLVTINILRCLLNKQRSLILPKKQYHAKHGVWEQLIQYVYEQKGKVYYGQQNQSEQIVDQYEFLERVKTYRLWERGNIDQYYKLML